MDPQEIEITNELRMANSAIQTAMMINILGNCSVESLQSVRQLLCEAELRIQQLLARINAAATTTQLDTPSCDSSVSSLSL